MHLAVVVHDDNLFPFDSPSSLSGNYSVPDMDALEPTGRQRPAPNGVWSVKFSNHARLLSGGQGSMVG